MCVTVDQRKRERRGDSRPEKERESDSRSQKEREGERECERESVCVCNSGPKKERE